MMTKEESETVKAVYRRLIENEDTTWSDYDENLEFFAYLSNSDLISECKVKNIKYADKIRCTLDHEEENCFAPQIMEATKSIIGLYDNTGFLHDKNKYILTCYLALSEMKLIF